MNSRSRIVAGVVGLGLVAMVSAQAGEMRFPVGLSYISGFKDVVDFYKEAKNAETSFYIPVGLVFSPYYEFDHGSRIGLDVGPAAILMLEKSGGSSSSSVSYWDVPVGLSYGFTFIPSASISPYARVGVKYHIVGGDYVDKSTPGAFAAAGVEFFRKSVVGVGLEAGYDASEVQMTNGEKIKTGAFMVSLKAVF